jgi:hypothetical protein
VTPKGFTPCSLVAPKHWVRHTEPGPWPECTAYAIHTPQLENMVNIQIDFPNLVPIPRKNKNRWEINCTNGPSRCWSNGNDLRVTSHSCATNGYRMALVMVTKTL